MIMRKANAGVKELFCRLQNNKSSTSNSYQLEEQKFLERLQRLHRVRNLNISSSRWIHKVSQSNNMFAVKAEFILGKRVIVEAGEKLFVIPLPNNLERY